MSLRTAIWLILSLFAISTAMAEDTEVFPANTFTDYWTGNAGWTANGTGGVIQLMPVTEHGREQPAKGLATTLMLAGQTCFLIQHSGVNDAPGTTSLIPDSAVKDNQCPAILTSMTVTASGQHAMVFRILGEGEVLASGEFKNSSRSTVVLGYAAPASARRSKIREPIKNYSATQAVAAAPAKPQKSKNQAVAATPVKPHKTENLPALPHSLEGLYVVTSSGLVTQLSANYQGVYEARIVRNNDFNRDAGRSKNQLINLVEHKSLTRLSIRDAMIITRDLRSSYRHCTEEIWSGSYNAAVEPIYKEANQQATDIWSVRHIGGACKRPLVNRNRCEMDSCREYENPVPKGKAGAVMLKNRQQAELLAQAKEAAYEGESYAEAEARADATPTRTISTGRSGSSERSPSYFERGGACGVISCDEQDTNQYIIDQVFGY